MRIQKKILNKLHFILAPLARRYLRKTRFYNYKGIKVEVQPSVFHPGLFFSTKVLLKYLQNSVDLKEKKVFDLGAGSGLLSVFCAKNGAEVTCSDINDVALEGLKNNAELNKVSLEIIKSDLFENIPEKELI